MIANFSFSTMENWKLSLIHSVWIDKLVLAFVVSKISLFGASSQIYQNINICGARWHFLCFTSTPALIVAAAMFFYVKNDSAGQCTFECPWTMDKANVAEQNTEVSFRRDQKEISNTLRAKCWNSIPPFWHRLMSRNLQYFFRNQWNILSFEWKYLDTPVRIRRIYRYAL